MNTKKSDFLLNPEITYLGFGSFGACPKPIFEVYQNFQRELEYEPVQFITRKGLQYLQTSKEALDKYLSCQADDLVFVTNPSYAVNIIAKSLQLKAGDEILTTNLEYGACDKTWQYYCDKAGAKYIKREIQLPIESKESFITNFLQGITPQTKLIFMSHITSVTGLRLPIEEICAYAKTLGITTFVDGAHAPGHISVNLRNLNADIYTGACHKWMLAPKGCSFLFVQKEIQNNFDPLVVSWGYHSMMPSDSQFQDYHQMQGTRDFSAFLTIPACVQYMHENNWNEVNTNCRKLSQDNALRFCELLNTSPISPIHDDFMAQMCSIPINCEKPADLQQLLYNHYQIEIPVMTINHNNYIRYSIQIFNDQDDLDRLYNALHKIKESTDLIF